MTTTTARRMTQRASLPTRIKPQLAALVKKAPAGTDWLHEIKLDVFGFTGRAINLARGTSYCGADNHSFHSLCDDLLSTKFQQSS
jgi:hypothetical protein